MNQKRTIGVKLMGSVAGLLAMILLLGISSWMAIGDLGDELQNATKVVGKRMELAGKIGEGVSRIRADQRGIVAFSVLKAQDKSQQAANSFNSDLSRLQALISDIRPLMTTERGKMLLADVESRLESWRSLIVETEGLCAAGTFDENLTRNIEASAATIEPLAKDITDFAALQSEMLDAASAHGLGVVANARWVTLALFVVGLAVAGVVVLAVRKITQQLGRIVTDLSESAHQVAGAAGQVAASSQALAQGASEQAASLEETSASSEEINSMAHKNTENSQAAAGLVTHSRQQFAGANHSLQEMVVAMDEIKTSSDKISRIIKTIDEIAFQTNILALNAAVEAARAGEAGMGFAVVADEVRNLAQRSAQAAKDTATLIEESIGRSNEGKNKVDHVAAAIRSITAEADKVNTLVDEVNVGSQEQTRGIEQIAKAISQMDQMTQRNAASAEQGASAAEELTAQSKAMMDVVGQLAAMVGHMTSMKAQPLTSKRPDAKEEAPALQPVAAAKRSPINFDESFPLD